MHRGNSHVETSEKQQELEPCEGRGEGEAKQPLRVQHDGYPQGSQARQSQRRGRGTEEPP